MAIQIDELPEEIIGNITENLEPKDQGHFRLVSKIIEEKSRHAFADNSKVISVAITCFSLLRMKDISDKPDFTKRVRNLEVCCVSPKIPFDVDQQ